MGMLYYRLSKFIKEKIGKHIDKKTAKLKKKMEKQHNISDWWFCVVCAKKYKKVHFLDRIKMYLHGFNSDQYVNYHLDKNNYKDYLTDVQRWKSRKINGDYNIVLDDKRLFYETFSKHLKVPKTLLFIKDDKIYDYETNELKDVKYVIELLKSHKGLAFKEISNGGGSGINILKYVEDKYYINNKEVDYDEVSSYISYIRNNLVTEYAFQHEYSNKIYSNAINTLRIVTIQTEENGAIVPLAMHRFGTNESGQVDNACSGGIFCPVDIKTGEIGQAMSYRNNDVLDVHPDTKEQIAGIIVPNFDKIKQKLIDVANKFPYINFVAWDVVVTDDNDFWVLEGNTSTGFGFFQCFKPYKNTELGKWYESKGI